MAARSWLRRSTRWGWLPVLAALFFSACNLPARNTLTAPSAVATSTNPGPAITEESLPPTSTLPATDTPPAAPTDLPLEPVVAASELPVTQAPAASPTNTPRVCFTLLAPADESVLSGTGKVTFEWQSMPEAVRYELLILLPSGRMETYATTEASFTRGLESLPLAGLYRWQVTAFDNAGERMCVVGMFRFTRPVVAPTPKPPKDDDNSDPIDFLMDSFLDW